MRRQAENMRVLVAAMLLTMILVLPALAAATTSKLKNSLQILSNLTVDGTLTQTGDATFSGAVNIPAGAIARADLTQEDLQTYPLSLQSDIRTNTGLVLDATGGAALFKIVNGGFGTGGLTINGNDASSATITSTLSCEFALPPEYVDGETVTLRVNGDLTGGGAFSTQTIDAEVYELTGAGAVGSDICATAAQTLAAASPAAYDFTITPAGLVAGDKLLIYVRTVVAETGTAASRAVIGNISVLADVKG